MRLIIAGAGAFAREVFEWSEDASEDGRLFQIGGFIGPAASSEGTILPAPYLGSYDSFLIQDDDRFLVAIGDPRIKLEVAAHLMDRGARFTNLIHPTAIVARSAIMGNGVILCPHALISVNAVIGDFVTINTKSTIGHDVKIGEGCTLSSFVDLTGGVSIDTGVFLGSHATVAPKCSIGAWVKVSAMTLVISNVKKACTVFGVPGRKIL